MTLKPIYESSLIWYTNGPCDDASKLGDNAKINDVEAYGHATSRDELFDLLEKTIRATIIVSDRDGFDMIKDLMNLNFNKTICEVIAKPDGTEGNLKELHDKYIISCVKTPLKKFNLEILGENASADDVAGAGDAHTKSAGLGFKAYKEKRSKIHLDKMSERNNVKDGNFNVAAAPKWFNNTQKLINLI